MSRRSRVEPGAWQWVGERHRLSSPGHGVAVAQLALGALAVVLVLFAVVVPPSTLRERRDMIDGHSCFLGFEHFDADSVEQVAVEWWPPRVQCKYHYAKYVGAPTVETSWVSRWGLYAPVVAVIVGVAAALAYAWSVHAARRRRRLTSAERGRGC